MKTFRWHRTSARLAAAAGLLALLVSAPPPAAAAPDSPATIGGKDHDPSGVEPNGIELRWTGPAFARLDEPLVSLRLTNRDRGAYAVSIRLLEDAGSLQTRRLGEPSFATIPAAGALDLPIRFGEGLPSKLTHSGMAVVLLTACPAQGGGCINGASEPLFFHPRAGRVLVYDETVLCQRFGCGALGRKSPAARGTLRVLGGGPLHDTRIDEEHETEDDDEVVDGGDQ